MRRFSVSMIFAGPGIVNRLYSEGFNVCVLHPCPRNHRVGLSGVDNKNVRTSATLLKLWVSIGTYSL